MVKMYKPKKDISDCLEIFLVFLINFSIGLKDPLGYSTLSQALFVISPTVMQWDKIVPEINNTNFDFLEHPTGGAECPMSILFVLLYHVPQCNVWLDTFKTLLA